MPMIGMKTHHSTSLENLLAVPDLQQFELQLQQFVLQPTRKRFLGSCRIHYGRAEEMHCSFSSHFNLQYFDTLYAQPQDQPSCMQLHYQGIWPNVP